MSRLNRKVTIREPKRSPNRFEKLLTKSVDESVAGISTQISTEMMI